MPALKQNNTESALRLEKILEREYKLYEEYLELLKEEEKYIVKVKTEKLTETTLRRAELCEAMKLAQEERQEIVLSFPECRELRLRKMALKCFHPQEAKKIIQKADELEKLARKTIREGHRHKQISSFGLKYVNGLLSMIWSATQNVLKSYTRRGGVQESYHPTNSRKERIIKEA